MNVFEFLGKPADYRASNKVVQLVKHWDDVNKNGKLHKKVSFPIFAQVKEDGVFAMLVMYKGTAAIFGRTGKKLTNVEYIEEEMEADLTPEGVYIAELCCDECSLEQLSGVTNPNRVLPLNPDQEYYKSLFCMQYHDHLTLCEFVSGHSARPYSKRHSKLVGSVGSLQDVLRLSTLHNEAELADYSRACIILGEEGAVFKQDVEWLAGAKDWHQMKKVRGVSYDLECIGAEEGKGKYSGKVANLLFRWKDGKTIKAMLGKGWTHSDAKLLHCEASANPIGKIFKVKALQESSKGVLRLPKVAEFRTDKELADF